MTTVFKYLRIYYIKNVEVDRHMEYFIETYISIFVIALVVFDLQNNNLGNSLFMDDTHWRT